MAGVIPVTAQAAVEPSLTSVSGALSPELASSQSSRWSEARIDEVIRTAKPIEAPPITASQPRQEIDKTAKVQSVARPEAASAPRIANLPAPATHGRMYISNPDGSTTGWCSASVINSGQRNLISTAAHCLHGGKGKNWLFNEAFFVPQLHGNSRPYGIFWAQRWTVWSTWTDDSDDDYDYGFVNLFSRNGQNVVDVVGANGLRVNAGYNQTVIVWGYPADSGYPGDVPYYCDKKATYGKWFDSWLYVDCTMTGGASGGPWLVDYDYNSRLGYVNALTSRGGINYTYSLSSYFNGYVADLYYLVD